MWWFGTQLFLCICCCCWCCGCIGSFWDKGSQTDAKLTPQLKVTLSSEMVSAHPAPLSILKSSSRKTDKIKIRPVSICHPFIHSFFYLTMSNSRYTSYTDLAMFVWDIFFFQRIKVPLPAPTSGSSQPLVTLAWGILTPSSGLLMDLQSCTQIYIQPHTHTHTSQIHVIRKAKQIFLITFWVVSLNCCLDTQSRSKVDRSKSLQWKHNCEKHYNSHLIF